jgi:hypothetical protein
MKAPIALVGLPEADGAVPMVLVAGNGPCSLLAGSLVGGAGIREVEILELEGAAAQAILDRTVGQHGLLPMPLTTALHYLLPEVDPETPGWVSFLERVEAGALQTARLVDPLARQEKEPPSGVPAPGPLLDPSFGVVFGLSADQVEAFLVPLIEAVQHGDRAGLTQIIAQAADDALDGPARARWALALDVLTVRGLSARDFSLARAAHEYRLSIAAGRAGSELPFVRVWVERALQSMAELTLSSVGPGPLAPRIARAQGHEPQ